MIAFHAKFFGSNGLEFINACMHGVINYSIHEYKFNLMYKVFFVKRVFFLARKTLT